MRKFFSFACATILMGLAACQTTDQQSAEASAVGLDRDAVMAHISGNTETWTKGGGYYAPDGQLKVLWEGEESVGTWEVSDDGQVCYVVDVWGSGKECHSYVSEQGQTKLFYEGKARVAKIVPGDQLGSL